MTRRRAGCVRHHSDTGVGKSEDITKDIFLESLSLTSGNKERRVSGVVMSDKSLLNRPGAESSRQHPRNDAAIQKTGTV